jgi:hypothetical protein
MKRSIILKLIFFGSFALLEFIFAAPTKTLASSPPLCGVLAPPTNPSETLGNYDCLAANGGQDYSTNTVESTTTPGQPDYGLDIATATSDQLKAIFLYNLSKYASIPDITMNNGSPVAPTLAYQKVGAETIINKYLGGSAQEYIDQPDVKFVYKSAKTWNINTAYNPVTDADSTYNDPGESPSPAVVIEVNTVSYFAIKLDCGNPISLGSPGSLPPPITINVLKVDTNGEWSGSSPSDAREFNSASIGITTPVLYGPASPTDANNVTWYLKASTSYTANAQTQDNSNNSIGGWTLKGYAICYTSGCNPMTDPTATTCYSGSSCNTLSSISTDSTPETINLDWIYNPPTTTTSISGAIYYYNAGQKTSLSGVSVYNSCNNAAVNPTNPTTNSSGVFSFTIPVGPPAFCIRAGTTTGTSPYTAIVGNTTYSNPVITPNNTTGGACSADTTASTYEQQTAGASSSSGTCSPTTNSGYNIEFTTKSTSSSTGHINGIKMDTSGNWSGSTPTADNGAFNQANVTIVNTSTHVSYNPPVENAFYSNDSSNGSNGLPVGTYTVTVSPVSGYTIEGYRYCQGAGGCTFSPSPGYIDLTSGNSFQVTLSAGSVVNVRFVFASGGSGCAGASCTTPTSNCPTFPNYTSVSVALPDNSPTIGAPSGATTTPHQHAVQDVPGGKMEVTAINDISSGGSREPPTLVSPALNTKVANTSAVLNYTPYVQNYPYDINQPSVNYVNYYNQTDWYTASSPSYHTYTCNSGDTGGGSSSTCSHLYTGTTHTTYTCNSGDTGGGSSSSCYHKYSGTAHENGLYTCHTGDGGGGMGSPTCTHIYTGAAHTTYTCHTGDSGGGSSSVCDHVYAGAATAWYDWASSNDTSTKETSSNTVDGGQMPACYNRTFSLIPNDGAESPDTNVTINNTEDPTRINVNGDVQGTFGVEYPGLGTGLRQPTQVNSITTEVTVEVYHQNSDGTVIGPTASYENVTSSNIKSSYASTSTSLSSTQSFSVPWSMAVQMPPLQYGDEVCIDLTTNPSAGQVTPPGWATQATAGLANQGNATGVAMWPIPDNPNDRVCSQYLAAEPYLKVFGGDVSTGADTKTLDSNNNEVCTTNSMAPITTQNQASAGQYAGSGAQLAAFAAGVISGFASAQNVSGSGLPPPPAASGLTFANIDGAQDYGGNFGASANSCLPDYYNQGVSTAQTANPPYTAQAALQAILTSGQTGNFAYKVNGGTIAATIIPTGDNIVLYSNEPVTITGNITYGGVSTNLSQMPSLEIVTNTSAMVGSNTTGININHNVTELDGAYVAEGSGGIINDCADITNLGNWFWDPTSGIALSNSSSCGQKLTVYGSFTAYALDLDRTNGSLHEATSTETYGTSNAAEEFDYSPLNWLVYPNQNTKPTIQAITSLPPVL